MRRGLGQNCTASDKDFAATKLRTELAHLSTTPEQVRDVTVIQIDALVLFAVALPTGGVNSNY